MAYPVESLPADATPEQVQKALEDTVAQMVSEGVDQNTAMQQAQDLMKNIAGTGFSTKKSTYWDTSAKQFDTGAGMSMGNSNFRGTIAPNPHLNNFNPTRGNY